jgi:DnaJ-class molecular chaperone
VDLIGQIFLIFFGVSLKPYIVLIDPKKREVYDKYGIVDEQYQDGFDDFFGDMGGCDYEDFLDQFMNMDFMFDMENMFASGFKMGGGGGRGRGKGMAKKAGRGPRGQPKVSKREEKEF